jgi:hypothetical protein
MKHHALTESPCTQGVHSVLPAPHGTAVQVLLPAVMSSDPADPRCACPVERDRVQAGAVPAGTQCPMPFSNVASSPVRLLADLVAAAV